MNQLIVSLSVIRNFNTGRSSGIVSFDFLSWIIDRYIIILPVSMTFSFNPIDPICSVTWASDNKAEHCRESGIDCVITV